MEEIKKIYPKKRMKQVDLACLIDSEEVMQEIADTLFKRFTTDFNEAWIKITNPSHSKCDLQITWVYPKRTVKYYNVQNADWNSKYDLKDGVNRFMESAKVKVRNIPVEINYVRGEDDEVPVERTDVWVLTENVDCISINWVNRQNLTLSFLISGQPFNYIKLKLNATNVLYLIGKLGYYVNKLITQ